MLRWTWPIGEFSGVYLCSAQFPFLFVFTSLRLNDMVYTCDTPLLLSNHGWLCWLSPTFALLGSLHWRVPGQEAIPAWCSRVCCVLIRFLCSFLQVLTLARLKVLRKPRCAFPLLWGAKCLVLGQALCSALSSAEHRIYIVHSCSSSKQDCEESLCLHDAHYEFLNASWPTAAVKRKTFL